MTDEDKRRIRDDMRREWRRLYNEWIEELTQTIKKVQPDHKYPEKTLW